LDLRQVETMALSLAEDVRRRTSVSDICNRLGLSWRLIEAIKCNPGRIGCALSHLRALRLSTADKPLLILEDDIGVGAHFGPVIEPPADADAIYLGGSVYGAADMIDYVGFTRMLAADPVGDDWLRVYNLLGTHAILYLTDAFKHATEEAILESLVDRDWEHDKGMVKLQERFTVYALRQPLFFQAAALQKGDGRHQESVTNVVLDPVAEGTRAKVQLEGEWHPVLLVRENGQLRWRFEPRGEP
jgi:hypothetical protein